MAYAIDTTPIYDRAVPMFRRVYYADAKGRQSEAWDGFRSREAAAIFWRMLARKSIEAWLPSGLDGWIPNKPEFGREPVSMKVRIDACERQYDDEGQAHSEGGEWAQLYLASVRRSA